MLSQRTSFKALRLYLQLFPHLVPKTRPAPEKQWLSHNLIVLHGLEIELEREVATSVGLIGEIEPDSRLELQRQIGYVAWHSSSNDFIEMKGRVTYVKSERAMNYY